MSFTLITITGSFKKQNGTPAAGVIEFQLSSPLIDSSTNQIREAVPVIATLDANGAISVSLTATDDPTTAPGGVTYTVIHRVTNAPRRVYSIQVPYNAVGGTIDLADAIPILGGIPMGLPDGTLTNPAWGFASEPGLGGWRLGPGRIGLSGSVHIKGPDPHADLRAWPGADPTGATPSDAALTDAQNALPANGGTVLMHGDFTFANSIVPRNGVTYQGGGAHGPTLIHTRIKYTGASHAITLTERSNCVFRNMMIESTTAGAGWVYGMDGAIGMRWNRFERVYFLGASSGSGVGIKLEGQVACVCFNEFLSCRFRNIGTAISLSGFANGNTFRDIWIGIVGTAISIRKTGTDTAAGNDNVFERVEINGSVTDGIMLGDQGNRNVFIKIVCDGPTGYGLFNNSDDNTFINCEFNGTVTDTRTTSTYINCKDLGALPGNRLPNLTLKGDLTVGGDDATASGAGLGTRLTRLSGGVQATIDRRIFSTNSPDYWDGFGVRWTAGAAGTVDSVGPVRGAYFYAAPTAEYMEWGFVNTSPFVLADLRTAGRLHNALAADETSLSVRRDLAGVETLQRVTQGAVDSGGAGFRVLRVPN